MYSQEECLPEDWKNCYTDVQDFCLLVFICPCVLSASDGLNSEYLAQSGSLGKAGSCVQGQGRGKKGCYFCRAVNPAPCASAAFFFYCLFLRSYCCNSTGCKQNLIYSKFRTGCAFCTFVGHLEIQSALSKSFSLKRNSFHAAWSFSVREISIFRERFYSKSYIRLCWGDHYFFIIYENTCYSVGVKNSV